MSRLPRFAFRLVVLALGSALAAHASETPPPHRWGPDAFQPVTAARIAALPTASQPAWRAYWEASSRQARPTTKPTDPVENTDHPLIDSAPIPAVYSTRLALDHPKAWYTSAAARVLADNVVAWQRPSGGWTKGGDYNRAPEPEDDHHDDWSAGTFDNNSTIQELRFLARVITAGETEPRAAAWRASFLRGLDYIFAAQYPNGGFPQIYPLAGGYHDAITFNDDAMVRILEFLGDIAARAPGYAFVPADRATLAAERRAQGIACILALQLRGPDGRRTVWGQQHDPLTLQPCAARNFEPIAACSNESAGIVEFLLTLPKPSPDIIAAVDGAMAWFAAHAMHGVTWERQIESGSGLVRRPDAPDLWARLYELETDRPVFGDRDRTVHYVVTEISSERRQGYGWYNSRPSTLPPLYAAWRARLKQ